MINIIVAFPKVENAKSIKNILIKYGYQVNAVCTAGARVLQYADALGEGIVVCAGKFQDMMFMQLREHLPTSFQMLVVASPNQWEEGTADGVICLSMPLKVHELVSTLEMMSHAFVRRRRKSPHTSRRNEEDRQMIEKAKEVLMARNNMTEEEAHRYIQKSSMDSGTGMAETAQMILSMMQG